MWRSMQVPQPTNSEALHSYPVAGTFVNSVASRPRVHACALSKVPTEAGRIQARLSASSVGAVVTSAIFSLRSTRVRRARLARAISASRLAELDPELATLLRCEKERQIKSINLIASENFAAPEVFEVLASELNNKYSEGIPGARYYGGNQFIDGVETLCQKRALDAFRLDEASWAVNVQPYSGSPANFAVYTALLRPHDRIMGMSLLCGGHLTHGHYTNQRRVSATSIYFESMPYGVHKDTGLIDYDALREQARIFRPRIIIAGASAYPRIIDWSAFRDICDDVGAYLLVDMAHISGLVATGMHPSPFPYADVVTTTTHKSLRGPRGGMIFCRREFQKAIDDAVFPALQGGPHNATIGALAHQLKQVKEPQFQDYCASVLANCRSLATHLQDHGCKLETDGTDNHLLLWNLRQEGLSGAKLEKVCEKVSIVLNRNAISGDPSPASPGGVRLGSCAMTTRGASEKDFERISDFLLRARDIALQIQARSGKKLADFMACLNEEASPEEARLLELREAVETWAAAKPFPS
eukprot:TRINITY_DN45847_c0_g1_i1.p1 TRINITY_DN45847_c0_g1~~TRINITY_DN45847_c0_g1_i1.p1  ORF type:complete len:528 (+),score=48.56 TRINITY_DN45847_c0_g1_i1:33-1616(+)